MLRIAVSAFSFFLSIFFNKTRTESTERLEKLIFYSAHFPNHSLSLTAGKGQGILPIV